MRQALLVVSRRPGFSGGGSLRIQALEEALRDAGFDTTYLTLSDDGGTTARSGSGLFEYLAGKFGDGVLASLRVVRDSLLVSERLLRRWGRMTDAPCIDLVVSSGPPHGVHVAARRICRTHSVPWIADLRDPWGGNAYQPVPRIIDGMLRWLERRILRSASQLTTSTHGIGGVVEGRTRLKNITVLRSPIEPRASNQVPPRRDGLDRLLLLHTGSLYGGIRDPEPFLRALKAVSLDHPDCTVTFVGRDSDLACRAATRAGIPNRVTCLDDEPRTQSLARQAAATALLVLQSAGPYERYFVPAKLFDYLGTGRPVLLVGNKNGEAAEIVARSGGFIAAAADEGDIERALRELLGEPNGRKSAALSGSLRTTADFKDAWLDLLRTCPGLSEQ